MGTNNTLTSLICIAFILLLPGCDLLTFPDDPDSVLPAEIDEDLTLLRSLSPYRIKGYSFVQPGVTLTIEEGTRIIADHQECDDEVLGSCATLIISQGATIIAEGTPSRPIIFTTSNGRRGDWGGIVINGNAPCNTGEDSEPLAMTGPYCGTDPEDSSGILRYVVVENAGVESFDDEITHYPAGISLRGVGSNTLVEYVHVTNTEFNGFSIVGGTVDLRYAIANCIAENGFAWYDGWQGRGQFWLSLQCSERARAGIFGANVPSLDINLDLFPASNPTIYNFTLLGPENRDSGQEGIELARGTRGQFVNGIIYNHKQKGFWIDDAETCVNIENGSIVMRNTYIANNERDFTNRCGEVDILLALGNVVGSSNPLRNPFDELAPDFKLTDEAAEFVTDPSAATIDWFEPADYIGAIGDEDWTLPLREAVE